MTYNQLKLENQLCFPIYAASRLVTKEYQPYLDELGITYPQYLVLLVLWENDGQTVNGISKKLLLKTNTVTPLLKRMEKQGLIVRRRAESDERRVIIKLTVKGKKMKEKAKVIPQHLAERLLDSELELHHLIQLKENLEAIISSLSK